MGIIQHIWGLQFICRNIPFVGPQRAVIKPFVDRKIPFVRIQDSGGFTFAELIVVFAVIAIIAALSAPAFTRLIESNRLTSATNSFLTDLSLARTEAIKRQEGQVVVCTSSSGTDCDGSTVPWRSGWIVFWDANSSNSYAAAENDVLLSVNDGFPATLGTDTDPDNIALIAYTRFGALVNTIGITSLEIVNTKIGTNRLVCFSGTGRASLQESCT